MITFSEFMHLHKVCILKRDYRNACKPNCSQYLKRLNFNSCYFKMWDFKSFLCNQPTKGVPDAKSCKPNTET